MSAPRRIIALLGAALMLAGPPAAATAQETVPTNVPPLSPNPPGEPDPAPPPPLPPPVSPTPSVSPTPPQRAGELPNTGADPRVLALLGSALLLAGVGLRLRAPDGRF